MMDYYFGAPIWTSRTWIGGLFPKGTKPGEFLRQYARRLTTVEGNTTFYAVPSENTIAQWAAETPESFRFCFKIPRAVSHAGKLADRIGEAHSFVERMYPLGPRLGPMFLQLPPVYAPNRLEDLKAFLAAWPAGVRLAVEVRHLGWFEPPHYQALNRLLAGYDFARVVIDTRPIRQLEGDPILKGSVYENLLQARRRKPDLPILPAETASFVFLRFIGHPEINLNRPFLEEWSDFLASRPQAVREAYLLCHCPEDRMDPQICREFHAAVARRLPIPALPWEALDEPPTEQPRLF